METSVDYKALYEEQLKITADLRFKIDAFGQEVAQLKKMIFGSRHERFEATDPDNLLAKSSLQLSLDLEADTIAACKITQATEVKYIRTKTEVTPNKPHLGRMALP